MPSPLSAFIAELCHRRVFRVAAWIFVHEDKGLRVKR